jgi:hypothetical protein
LFECFATNESCAISVLREHRKGSRSTQKYLSERAGIELVRTAIVPCPTQNGGIHGWLVSNMVCPKLLESLLNRVDGREAVLMLKVFGI